MTAREDTGGAAAAGPRDGSAALRDAVARYVAANPASAARAQRAAASLPGANTRSVLHFDPFPLAFERAEGAYLYSLDGARYTDFLGEFTAGLYGHSHPVILDAIRTALDRGLNYGGHSELEGQLAELLIARFTAHGARALHELRHRGEPDGAGARAAPHRAGREILVFKGGYHGGVLAFGGGEPSPVTVPHAWVIGDFDDVEATRALIREHELGRDPRRADAGLGRLPPGLARVPGDAARGGDAHRRAADLRRGHDVAARPARRARVRRRGPGPDDGRQVPRGRHVVRRVRRPSRR